MGDRAKERKLFTLRSGGVEAGTESTASTASTARPSAYEVIDEEKGE